MKFIKFPFLTLLFVFINYYVTFIAKASFLFFFYHLSFQHFLNNMLLFLLFGTIIEIRYGRKAFLLVFLLSFLFSIILQMIFVSVMFYGFSGVVSGFMSYGFIKLIDYNSKNGFVIFAIILYYVFFLFLFYSFYDAIFFRRNIAIFCHIGGLVSGVMLSILPINITK